jgi:hypothetical protein
LQLFGSFFSLCPTPLNTEHQVCVSTASGTDDQSFEDKEEKKVNNFSQREIYNPMCSV